MVKNIETVKWLYSILLLLYTKSLRQKKMSFIFVCAFVLYFEE